MGNNLKKGQEVIFANDPLPFKVMAVSERYAVVSRKLHRRQDAGLLHHQVEMNAYCSFTEAFNAQKNNPVYSILDFKQGVRAPDNLIFGSYDYFDEKSCQKAIKALEKGEIELSRRNYTTIEIKSIGLT